MKNVLQLGTLRENILREMYLARLSGAPRMPSEKELARKYDFPVSTIRSVLGKLITEGLIYKKDRSGYFLSQQNTAIRSRMRRAVLLVNSQGNIPDWQKQFYLQYFAQEALTAGITADIHFTKNNVETEREFLLKTIDDNETALIFFQPVFPQNYDLIYQARLRSLAWIFCDKRPLLYSADFAGTDNYEIGCIAGNHACSYEKAERAVYLGYDEDSYNESIHPKKESFYRTAGRRLETTGFFINFKKATAGEINFKYELEKYLHSCDLRRTVIFASTRSFTLNSLRILEKDTTLQYFIGCDENACYRGLSITAVLQAWQNVARQAFKWILTGPENMVKQILFPPVLYVGKFGEEK